MPGLHRAAVLNSGLLALLELSGENVREVARLLRELLVDYPEHAGLIASVRDREHRGDHRPRHHPPPRWQRQRRRRRPSARWRAPRDRPHRREPLDAQRLRRACLATALHDIVDFAEQTADPLGVDGVQAPMEQSVALAEVLVAASDEVARTVAALGAGGAAALAPALSEIHRLESEGDRVLRDGLACLFDDGIDPMVVIRWKDIFESLESAVDACQTVAHLIEGISLKRGVGRR